MMIRESLDIDPDGQDDRRDALPAQLLLDGEGRFVVEDTVDEAGPAEDGLSGEDGRSGELADDALAQGRSRLDDVDAGIEARLGREAELAGHLDVFLEGALGRLGQPADGVRLPEGPGVALR